MRATLPSMALFSAILALGSFASGQISAQIIVGSGIGYKREDPDRYTFCYLPYGKNSEIYEIYVSDIFYGKQYPAGGSGIIQFFNYTKSNYVSEYRPVQASCNRYENAEDAEDARDKILAESAASVVRVPENFVTEWKRYDGGTTDESKLRTTFLRFAEPGRNLNGYHTASVNIKYQFIACMGEVHLAYGIDPGSVEVHRAYAFNGDRVDSSAAPVPMISSTGMIVSVFQKGDGGERKIGTVMDPNAGRALGYGCFTGQTRKVGMVRDFIQGQLSRRAVNAYLNETLSIGLGAVDPWRPLVNRDLESLASQGLANGNGKVDRERAAREEREREREQKERLAEEERAGTSALNAQQGSAAAAQSAQFLAEKKAFADAKAKHDAELLAYEAAKRTHEEAVRRAAEARQKWEADVTACRAGQYDRCAAPPRGSQGADS